MFFNRSSQKRSSSPIVSFLRLILTVIVFGFLMGGLYMAFQSFSGVDPLTINPKSVIRALTSSKDPRQIVESLSQLDLQKIVQLSKQDQLIQDLPQSDVSSDTSSDTQKGVSFSFILVSDSHGENNYLKKALEQGKEKTRNLSFIIGIGDYSEVGTIQELKSAKLEFDSAGIRYFLLPGDHDMWDARDKQKNPVVNFKAVFGSSYQSFVFQGVKFILLDNADNYNGIDQAQLDWLDQELLKARLQDNAQLVFVFMHEPLYHPSSAHIMGRVTDDLKKQSRSLLASIKSGGVNEVFSGDIHFFTRYQEPTFKLNMTTIGAVASNRNTQSPRFAIVSVYNDGSYGVEDIEIK